MIKALTSPIKPNKEEKQKYRRQVALSLLILYVAASLANIAFIRELNRLKFESGVIENKLYKPVYDHIIETGIFSLIIGAVIIFIGLWVSSGANLGAPVLARLFSKKTISELMDWKSFLSGVVLAIFIAIALLVLFELQNLFYPVTALQERPSKWYYVLVSIVVGINEEIIYRLGLMSLIVTAILYFKNLKEPTNHIIWAGIIISAFIFGLMHFPITSNFFKLTPLTIGVTMTGNLITGTTFGWIFWKRGLLIAMLSHIAFDLTFHVIGSPFG